jgi:hypothetical protein
MATVKKVKLSDIEPDLLNANRHTERGNVMLRQSMEQFGFAEAGTLDKNNRIIGGNHRTEVAADVLATDDVIIIEVDGTKPVYLKRSDLDLDTGEGRRLSLLLNKVAQESIDWDPEILWAAIESGVTVNDIFREDEIKKILKDFEDVELDDLFRVNDGGEENGALKLLVTVEEKNGQQFMDLLDTWKRKGVTWQRRD